MTSRLLIFPLAIWASAQVTPASAQDAPPLAPRTALSDLPLEGPRAAMRLDHVSLSFAVDPEERRISGDARLAIVANAELASLELDLDPRFAIAAITLDGAPLSTNAWSNPDGLLAVALPQPLAAGNRASLRIIYSGQPHEARNAPWDGGFVWSSFNGQPWVATAVQGEGCDMFWPCIDHSSSRIGTLDLLVTVPDGLVAAGNGALVEMVDNQGGTTTFHWRARDPSNYGVTLQIGPYQLAQRDHVSRFANVIPLRFWHLPGNAEGAERLLDELEDQIAFMEATFGPYPFADEKAGIAETPHLGMEHQTINAYGNRFQREPYGHDWLLQHEFAHEWFANQLRNATINHMWLAEGIGTWTQPLYLEWARGRMFYEAEMWKNRQRVWSRVPLVPPEGELPDYGDREARWGDDIYFKGAWIMHTLRWLVGDEVLFPAVTRLTYGVDNPRPGAIQPMIRNTEDFRAILEEMSGRELDWFFDAYFYQAPLPRLVERREGRWLGLEWETPSALPFAMDVEVRIGDEVTLVPMPEGHARVDLGSDSAHYLVDPANRILRYDAAVAAIQQTNR